MINVVGRIAVLPRLPAAIERLHEVAHNLWWSWEPAAQDLYARLDIDLWERVNHNPVKLLQQIQQERLDHAAGDTDYLEAYSEVLAAFDAYMDPATPTWYRTHHGDRKDQLIAYFSAEFGLHEALPIYSGGLGILSGDHCKAASDLGLPFIGIGFLYPQGYFTQRIDESGRQQAEYEKIDFAEVPAVPALDDNGQDIMIGVDLPGRTVFAKLWRIQVGRIPIYLMDTDVDRNAPQDRELSARLYGGDREMRISQEVVLGIGGVRAVRALGLRPSVWHMNEGHSAFLGLERVRLLVQENELNWDEAVQVVRSDSLFTTHTPVPAGNDAFSFELIDKFFWQYWGQLGIDRERFIQFARQELPWGPQYSMTVLALRLSGYHNGVSKLHGHVSRGMWQFLWQDIPRAEVPIGDITNGVHTKTWLARELRDLYSNYFSPDWRERVEEPDTWIPVDDIPDKDLWSVHQALKEKLVRFVRQRMQRQLIRHGEAPDQVARAGQVLDANALTIGFARRFATYKRATLIFHDLERLTRILNDPSRPVQIVFSGKAHPDDEPGKALIQRIYELSHSAELSGKIVFVEDYDMNIARHMVGGVDLWLNTPRRPREASGTSGQKAALSGIPNCSILDGWWDEGYDGTNGWAIGEERDYKDTETQDAADAQSLYTLLEDSIVPLYYSRNREGIPSGWVEVMKNAIRTCAPRFSMRRMVIDYTEQYYLPAGISGETFSANNFALAHDITALRSNLQRRWNDVHVEVEHLSTDSLRVGDSLDVTARVWHHAIDPKHIAVEAVYGEQGSEGEWIEPQVVPMRRNGQEGDAGIYEVNLVPQRSGRLAIGVRVRPHDPRLIEPYSLGLVRWAAPTV